MGTGRTILLVEDDQSVRKLISGVLESRGYFVISCVDGEAALAASGSHAGDIHLIVTDFGLGELNGLQLAARIADTRPGIGTLLISGYTEIPMPPEMRDRLRAEFLPKPFSMEAMLAKVADLIAAGK